MRRRAQSGNKQVKRLPKRKAFWHWLKISAEEGRLAEAETAARKTMEEFRAEKQPQMEILAEVEEASRIGDLGCEFEARLAFGKMLVKSGNTALGRAELEALSRDAETRSFFRVARNARQAAG